MRVALQIKFVTFFFYYMKKGDMDSRCFLFISVWFKIPYSLFYRFICRLLKECMGFTGNTWLNPTILSSLRSRLKITTIKHYYCHLNKHHTPLLKALKWHYQKHHKSVSLMVVYKLQNYLN